MDWSPYFFIARLIGTRYFLFAGIAFLLGYVIFRKKIQGKKIQGKFPQDKDYFREIGYSILTIFIFAAVPVLLIYNNSIRPLTMYYTEIGQHGWGYFFGAFPIMLIVHDTYFYWTHRLMHHPKIFRYFHLVHHKSTNPSPWAAYSFHPLEAIVEAGVVVVFLFIMPIHKLHLGLFFLFMIIYNVYGHLGYELYPKSFSRNRIGRWINTSVNHNQHHQYFKGNYGLYFLFWDRVMGTIRPDYEQFFEEVKSRQ
ncbi:sterol desaturase family protein [Flavihumibacter profundi]|uniref:sterol desaturase family protein n=1 Tax=Flavihumibacter profundi TaxID=2716883 RepID=UPI001CC40215|nr:sterol desaturase family protein [Flavihumibacter profundi]MBZ5859017.1 sterol desaturase family protein [Flavihumibacter profundi]